MLKDKERNSYISSSIPPLFSRLLRPLLTVLERCKYYTTAFEALRKDLSNAISATEPLAKECTAAQQMYNFSI